MKRLILASSSPYRRALLERLGLDFECVAPRIDETRLAGESAAEMVQRLARRKAEAVSRQQGDALIIGSDQCAVVDGTILGKPGTEAAAIGQLRDVAGRTQVFHTGLCLLNGADGQVQVDDIEYRVRFRSLTEAQIRAYVRRDGPLDCAGSIRAEGLGIALFESMQGADPTALTGLPLIRLTSMLEWAGLAVL